MLSSLFLLKHSEIRGFVSICVRACVCVVYDTYRKLGKARSIFQIFTFGNITGRRQPYILVGLSVRR